LDILQTLVLATGLGLLGFVEPCSVGSHLIFVKFLDQLPARQRWLQTLVFTGVRALFMGLLGVLAALIGVLFLGVQHALWITLGSLYVLLGSVYLGGGAPWIIRRTNRVLPRLSPGSGGVGLGALFALNIPACAAPLLAVLLGGAAARASAGGGVTYGGLSLLVFGLALSSTPGARGVHPARAPTAQRDCPPGCPHAALDRGGPHPAGTLVHHIGVEPAVVFNAYLQV